MKKNLGFTLIEMAAVITIIALLIGGITAGAKLKRNSELASLISEMQAYQSAVNNFSLQYQAWPGDMVNAVDFWPTTVNGNGDGLISTGERFRAWQQLSLAGVISGSYDGTSQYGISSFCKGCFYVFYAQPLAVWDKPASTINALTLTQTSLWQPVLAPIDAESIDRKIDDAIGSRGKMVGMGAASSAADCLRQTDNVTVANYTTYNTLVADYSHNQSTKTCVPRFYWQ